MAQDDSTHHSFVEDVEQFISDDVTVMRDLLRSVRGSLPVSMQLVAIPDEDDAVA